MQPTVLITGCSSGIGLSAALTLHRRGYRVFASARKETDVKILQQQGLIDSLMLDIEDSDSIQRGLAEVLAKTGGTLDALINNAGYAIPGAVEDLSRDLMRKQFETNVFGTMELTNRVIPIMRQQGSGRIIQVTSILGIIAMPYRGAYNASKFALEGFSNTLRMELRDSPIKVIMIVPGPIATRFRQNSVAVYDKTLKGKDSVHQDRYHKMSAQFTTPAPKSEKLFTLPPEAVVDKMITALESKRPSAHYYIGLPAKLFAFLRRLLPDCCLDWVLDLSLRGEKK